MADTSVLRFADPLGPQARRRVVWATVVSIAVLALVVYGAFTRFADNGQFDPKLWKPFWSVDAVKTYGFALGVTLRAAAAGMVIGLVSGLVLALGRLSRIRLLRGALTVWVEFFRGIPLALLIVFLFFGMPQIGVDLGNYWALVLGLALYNSAVICEIVRAGVLTLDRGQTEAALAIGLTDAAALRLIVLPQALRRMIPALVSQLVVILKDTSLGVAISYEELLRRAQQVGTDINARLQAILVAAAVYFVVNFTLSLVARRLERRQDRVRRAAKAEGISVQQVENLSVPV
jgi:glutamate transport system permease protein